MKNSYQVGYLCGYMQKRAEGEDPQLGGGGGGGVTDVAEAEARKQAIKDAMNKAMGIAKGPAGQAVGGAALGAATGAAVAGKGKRGKGALIGGVTGAVAAPAAVYLAQKLQERQAMAGMRADIERSQSLDTSGSAVKAGQR
jgi:hypothetical protein